MGRPNSGLKRHFQAHCHNAKKTLISIRYRPGVKESICTGRGGWAKKDSMTLKEVLKEMNRLKSNCSAKSSIYALLLVHCLKGLDVLGLGLYLGAILGLEGLSKK